MKVRVQKKLTPVRKREKFRVQILGHNGEEIVGGEKLTNATHARDIAERLYAGDIDEIDLTALGGRK